eukprot:gene18570-15303_t
MVTALSTGEAWGRERGGGGAALGAAGLKIVWIDRKFKIDNAFFAECQRSYTPEYRYSGAQSTGSRLPSVNKRLG